MRAVGVDTVQIVRFAVAGKCPVAQLPWRVVFVPPQRHAAGAEHCGIKKMNHQTADKNAKRVLPALVLNANKVAALAEDGAAAAEDRVGAGAVVDAVVGVHLLHNAHNKR